MSVVPLLEHEDEQVRAAVIRFLFWARDRRTLEPLCEALDAAGHDKRWMEEIGRVLVRLQHPSSGPALRRAVDRGAGGWVYIALGRTGTEEDFEPLLDAAVRTDSLDAGEGPPVTRAAFE